MAKLNFSSYSIHLNKKNLNEESFILLSTSEEKYFFNENDFIVNCQYDKKNNFLWLYFKYGKGKPFSPQTFDSEKIEIIETKRLPTDVELNKQIFAFYDLNNLKFHISHSKKKLLLKDYLSKKLDGEVIIKSSYKTEEEFYNIIEGIKEIRLCVKNNLFTYASDTIFDQKIDRFGLGSPKQYEIKCRFEKVKKTEQFKSWLISMVNKKQQCEIEELFCVGYDDDDMDQVFNIDKFSTKFDITVSDINGMVDFENVKHTICTKLRGSYNV